MDSCNANRETEELEMELQAQYDIRDTAAVRLLEIIVIAPYLGTRNLGI